MLIILIILILIIGTAALMFWNFLFFIARSADEQEIAHYTYRALQDKIRTLADKYKADMAELDKRTGISRAFRQFMHDPKTSEKQARQIQKNEKSIIFRLTDIPLFIKYSGTSIITSTPQ